MALMFCCAFFQFYVAPATTPGGEGQLSCQLYQRSANIFLGLRFVSGIPVKERECHQVHLSLFFTHSATDSE